MHTGGHTTIQDKKSVAINLGRTLVEVRGYTIQSNVKLLLPGLNWEESWPNKREG